MVQEVFVCAGPVRGGNAIASGQVLSVQVDQNAVAVKRIEILYLIGKSRHNLKTLRRFFPFSLDVVHGIEFVAVIPQTQTPLHRLR